MSAYKSPLKNVTLWFTGISGAGKTTIATGVVEKLEAMGYRARNLDGDDFRDRLNKDLGFSVRDRQENIRRVSEVATIVAELGVITVVSLISPLRDARSQARKIHDKRGLIFLECYIDTPLEECERRDVKGLYKKCRQGELKNFTGIDSPYEVPENPELIIRTLDLKVDESINKVISLLEKRECIESSTWPKLIKCNDYASASNDNHNHKTENGLNHQNGFLKNGHSKAPRLIEENFSQISVLRSSQDLEISTKRDCSPKMPESIDRPMKPYIKELFVSEVEKKSLIPRLSSIPRLNITKIDLQWIQVLSEGWATPLEGFMREKEYMECVFTGSLDGGKINQTIPIVLAVENEDKIGLEKAREIGLWYEGECYAVLKDPEFYRHRKEERCARTFCTTHSGHPMIEMIYKSGDYLVGGRLRVLDRIKWNDGLDEYRLTPIELQKRFEAIQADAVYAFQTRNPIHNGHALLMQETRKRLLEKGYQKPTLLLHPLGGWTKGDDVPLKVRIEQHKAVLSEGILDADNTVLAIFPSPMNYAGPIEVQWHCKARLVTGANFYIVGRDPAGIPHPDGSGDLYQPEYGSEILKKARGLDRLQVIPFLPAAYDKKKGCMDFYDPTREKEYEFISGTKMRTLARLGQNPPKGFMSNKGWEVLANFYRRESTEENKDASSSKP